MKIIIVLLSLLFICFLLYSELSYISSKGIKFLYNIFSRIYELKWKLDKTYLNKEINNRLFIKPILDSSGQESTSKFIDLACGTGRLSLLLLECTDFKGQIEAYDISSGMLDIFKKHIDKLDIKEKNRIKIFQADLIKWKCSEENKNSCSAIAITEAGEFLSNFPELIEEIYKILKPNALFLLTKPVERIAWTFFGRKQSKNQIIKLLEEKGFINIQIYSWTSHYDVIHCYKK